MLVLFQKGTVSDIDLHSSQPTICHTVQIPKVEPKIRIYCFANITKV